MKRNNMFRNGLFYLIVFVLIIGFVSWLSGDTESQQATTISSTEFVQHLEDDDIESFVIQPIAGVYRVQGEFEEPQTIEQDDQIPGLFGDTTPQETTVFNTTVLQNDPLVNEIFSIAKTTGTEVVPQQEEQASIWVNLLLTFLPLLIFVGFIYMMMSRSGQGGGGGRGVMNFGKSKAKEADPGQSNVRFSDVAGAEEEKAELVEIVEFLRDPRKFTELGARIPSGVLLEGPPGTGKTLLAKAVAGEAGVPFYSISGSEFVEMFVGVGASRVRDLFEEAKKNSPSIIFIDEIDAVGRKRGTGQGGGNDEREQTLNQLLVEMDGFTGKEGVIVMAATNRSDVLDKALLRPGRFDRRILIGMPDVREREAILRVHAKDKPLSSEVDLKAVAKTTPGFSGADLENLLNEAALVAARRDSKIIEPYDVDEASDRVIAGPAKRDRIISENERRMVAYHEAGHTIVGLVLSDARVVHKVTIVPRGKAGGYAIMLPREDRYLLTKKDLYEQIVGLLGGRGAEEKFFNTQSTGASNDFEQATKLARAMVTQYGMSDDLGVVQYGSNDENQFIASKPYSERIAYDIDLEVKGLLDRALNEAHRIIDDNRERLTVIAETLLEVETLNEEEIKSLYETGKMPEEGGKEYPRESELEKEKDLEPSEPITGKSFDEIREEQEKAEAKRGEVYSDRHGIDEDSGEKETASSENKEDDTSSEGRAGSDPRRNVSGSTTGRESDDEVRDNAHIEQDRTSIKRRKIDDKEDSEE